MGSQFVENRFQLQALTFQFLLLALQFAAKRVIAAGQKRLRLFQRKAVAFQFLDKQHFFQLGTLIVAVAGETVGFRRSQQTDVVIVTQGLHAYLTDFRKLANLIHKFTLLSVTSRMLHRV